VNTTVVSLCLFFIVTSLFHLVIFQLGACWKRTIRYLVSSLTCLPYNAWTSCNLIGPSSFHYRAKSSMLAHNRQSTNLHQQNSTAGFPCLQERPGFFSLNFQVLESPGKISLKITRHWNLPHLKHWIWSVDSQQNSWNCCHQMSYFKAKMHQIRFRLGLCPRPRVGLCPRPRVGLCPRPRAEQAHGAPPHPTAGFKGSYFWGKRRGGSTVVRRRGEGFFIIFKHSWAPKRSWKISHGGPGKVLDFLTVKEWEPWYCG